MHVCRNEYMCTVEPMNRGHVGASLCREVVLSSEFRRSEFIEYGKINIGDFEVCPL